jgi:single-strand DNA-binding protein
MTMIGFLGQDAEVRDANGQKVISFRIAHTEKYTDRSGNPVENTTWVGCSYWRPADRTGVAQYLKKGTQVYVEGFPSARAYQTKDGQNAASLDMRVLSLELLGSKGSNAGGNMGGPQAETVARPAPIAYQDSQAQDDDLPF